MLVSIRHMVGGTLVVCPSKITNMSFDLYSGAVFNIIRREALPPSVGNGSIRTWRLRARVVLTEIHFSWGIRDVIDKVWNHTVIGTFFNGRTDRSGKLGLLSAIVTNLHAMCLIESKHVQEINSNCPEKQW